MVTLRDIARQAGVSHVAVSRVLNGRAQGEVSAARAATIRRTAARLGYVPNTAARALRTGRTSTIVMATRSGLRYPYVHEFVEQLHAELTAHGYHLDLELLYFVPDPAAVYRTFTPTRCDGLVLFGGAGADRAELTRVRRAGLPVALVMADEPRPANARFDIVDFDRVEAVRLALHHLAAGGHRRIGLVLNPGECRSHSARWRACRRVLKAHGLPWDDSVVFPCTVQSDPGELWKRLRGAHPRPTALFVFNEEVAMGLLHHMRLDGVRVPDDIAMVTDGNPSHIRFADVPLTAVDHGNAAVAAAVVECLLARIRHPSRAARTRFVRPTLVVRESSRSTGDMPCSDVRT